MRFSNSQKLFLKQRMDNTSLTDKIKVAQGFLDSAQLLERTLNQIVAKSPAKAEMKVENVYCHRKLGPLSKTRLCYNDNLLERSLRLSYKCIITNALTLC